MSIANRLTYTLHSPSAGGRQVFPTGESTFKIKKELHNDDTDDSDPVYDYTITTDGTLNFVGDDYAWIKAIEDDTSVRGEDLLIEMADINTGEILVPGSKLVLNTGVFDLDRCTLDIPVTIPDVYEVFNAAKDDELNMFDLLISGPFYDVNVLDYYPKFEVNYSIISNLASLGGPGWFDLSSQAFGYYPNSKAQYPGFGCEGEIPDPDYPNAAARLFESNDLVTMTNNAITGTPELNVGTYPYHNLYPGDALSAKADAWRLYAFDYDIFNDTASSPTMFYAGYFGWIREIKDVVIGSTMTPEWVYVGIVGGMDRWARPPILVPRTNVNKTAFRFDAIPTEAIVRLIQTTYVVGLDVANVVLCSGVGQTFPDLTTIPPTMSIMNADQDRENENYYSFAAITNGKSLNDIIPWAVGYCDPSLTVVSDFFQINAVTPSTDNPVTGVASYTNDIIMLQKSDVKRAFATNKATIGTFTTSSLFTWLMQMFDIRFRIEGTNFLLEHVTSAVFVKAATMNLTTPPLNARLAGLRRYSYATTAMLPAKETFMFMEARPQGLTDPLNDFNGLPILYYGSNVDRTLKTGVMAHVVDSVTTDVYFIFIHSDGIGYIIDQTTKNPTPVQNAAEDDTISDDGFCLIATKVIVTGGITSRHMIIGDPIIGTDREMNNVLGWAFLHRDFHMTNRNTKLGSLNGIDVTFTTTKYLKQSVELNFDLCNFNDFDPFKLIISALGMGIVNTAEFSILDSSLTVILGYQE